MNVLLLKRFTSLSRLKKNLIFIIIDSLTIFAVILASFSIRLGEFYWPDSDLLWVIIGSPIIAIPIFIRFSIYNTTIRFIGFNAIWDIAKAVSLYALVWGIICYLSAIDGIPRSVIIINGFLAIIAISGLRLLARWVIFEVLNYNSLNRVNVLIYGAGAAGRQLAVSLLHSNEFNPIAFIDDNSKLYGQSLHGLKVSSSDDLGKLIHKWDILEILIAIPSLMRSKRNEIISNLETYPVHVRSLPSLEELVQGKVKVADLREVSIKDILGRNHTSPNKDLLDLNINNKVVMVTGAGGSIGSELSRQIIRLRPKILILYDQSEFALYSIDKELSKINLVNIKVISMLGSVQNMRRLQYIFQHYEVQTVYHAAAYKHVPLVEYNTSEGVQNNIIGTLNCSMAADLEGVETFVLISTDKAVRPTNVMGASKRFAEIILQVLSNDSKAFVSAFNHGPINSKRKKLKKTRFSIVRFGNVLNSSGSVVPLFKQQIIDGGPLTVTDPKVIRYFMTTSEAVELVIQSGAMGIGGEVFVLNMGEPVLILDLAKKMIHLSGMEVKDSSNPKGDIEIQFTGLRPGEKLFEELLIGENSSPTDNPMIMKAREESLTLDELKLSIDKITLAIQNNDPELLRDLLMKTISGFKPDSQIKDNLYNA